MSSNRRKMLEASAKRRKLKKDYTNSNRSYAEVNRQCLKKKIYSSEGLAQKVIKDIKNDRGTSMRVYECNICGFYHITHRK